MYKYMAIRRADIRRMENKDLSRWAQRPKKAEAPARALPERIETQADKARMASELLEDPAVQRIMAEADAYERDLDLESDAIQYASNKRIDYSNLTSPGKAGDKFISMLHDPNLPFETRMEMIDQVRDELIEIVDAGQLPGNVPGPRVLKNSRGERRIHTKYEKNPITNQHELVAFMDPSNPDVPLVTTFERRPDLRPPNLPGGTDPSAVELLQLQALKLAGMDAGLHGTGNAPHHYADFKVNTPSRQINVEGMMVNRGDDFLNKGMAIPSYTNLSVNDDPSGFNQKAVAGMIKDEASDVLKTTNQIKAAENLVKNKVLGPNDPTRFGKLMRSELGNVNNDPQAVYDAMIVTGMNNYASGTDKYEQYLYPPDTLHYIPNVKATKDAVMNDAGNFRMFSTPSAGVRGTGHRRAKLQHVVPNNHPTVVDLTKVSPYTAQLLRDLPYV